MWIGIYGKGKERGKGSNFLLVTSADTIHTIPKLCVGRHLSADFVKCPPYRSISNPTACYN